MLKSIATARCESTAKQENKVSTYYIVPDLIDFFGNDLERDQSAD